MRENVDVIFLMGGPNFERVYFFYFPRHLRFRQSPHVEGLLNLDTATRGIDWLSFV